MNSRIVAVIVVLVLIAGAGIFLSTRKGTSAPVVQPTPTPQMTQKATPTPLSQAPTGSVSGTMTQGQTQKFTVTGKNFSFTPKTLTVKKGDTVSITFTNAEGFHDFVLDEFNVRTKVIPAGQSETVTFTADKAGTFEYYCSVGNHRAMGMTGTLTVE